MRSVDERGWEVIVVAMGEGARDTVRRCVVWSSGAISDPEGTVTGLVERGRRGILPGIEFRVVEVGLSDLMGKWAVASCYRLCR